MIQHDVPVGKLDYCQVCGSEELFEAIDLGAQPACGTLLNKEDLKDPETYYSLCLMVCPKCGLGQLDYVLGSKICFPKDYPYRPGISAPLRDHLERLAAKTIATNTIAPGSLVVDVGSNDGTLLSFFKQGGMKVLGVEPTDMAKVAVKDGIPTLQKFFNKKVAEDIVAKHGKAKVITFTNVFAHMASLGEVMDGLVALLDVDGVIVTESQYLLDVFERNQFDEIYHDHIRVYSLKSLVSLFSQYGLEVFTAYRIQTREGSIEASAGWDKQHAVQSSVQEIVTSEENAGLFTKEGWLKFQAGVQEQKRQFLELVQQMKKEGKKLVADSCPTRGVVLLNYYGLDAKTLEYVSQIPNTEKIGKYIPGTHNPIVSNEIIPQENPDYVLVLAWHYDEYIVNNWKAKGVTSKFIIPLPTFKVV